jgi:hypothetical protein
MSSSGKGEFPFGDDVFLREREKSAPSPSGRGEFPFGDDVYLRESGNNPPA